MEYITKKMLTLEEGFLATDKELYLECLNGNPLKDRTEEQARDGAILFWHVYHVCAGIKLN